MVGGGLRCPECDSDTGLTRQRGPLGGDGCPSCGGVLLRPEGKLKALKRAGQEPRPATIPLKAILCPECGASLRRSLLRDAPFAPCSTCGVAWVGPGPLPDWLTGRASGGGVRPSRSGGGGRRHSALALGLGLALAAGAAALILRARDAKEPAQEGTPPSPTRPSSAAAATPSRAWVPPRRSREPLKEPAVFGPLEGLAAQVEELDLGPGAPRVLLAPRAGLEATLLVSFAAGSFEDAVAGQTHVAQHALLASNRRFALARFLLDVRAAGARFGFRTGVRESTFQLTADRRDFPALARTLSEGVLDPSFEPLVLSGATARALLDPASPPSAGELVAEVAAEEAGYGNPPVAARPDIIAISHAQVSARLASGFTPANATVVVAGAFDRAEVVRLLKRFRGGTRAQPRPLALPLPFEARRPSDRPMVLFAAPLEPSSARDAAAARLAAALLDAGLWERFRMGGAGYSPEATVFRAPWTTVLVAILPAHEYERRLEAKLRELVNDLRSGGFSARDLERAKGFVRGELAAVDSDPAALAAALAAGGPSWHGREVALAVDALDRVALTELLSRWLDPARSIYFIAGGSL